MDSTIKKKMKKMRWEDCQDMERYQGKEKKERMIRQLVYREDSKPFHPQRASHLEEEEP
jgi:hypothetical protein